MLSDMLTGKISSRALQFVCGHMLIDAALITILVAKVYHIISPTKDTDDPRRDIASTDSDIDDEETRYK